jgi:DNA-binding transcriptional regulator of glucitol operon
VRTRWLSWRAIGLHLAVLVWVPGCLIAGWWQVTRALGGNDLSYLYSVEWPVFALVGIWAWWVLVHTDPETVGARAQRRMAVPQTSPETNPDMTKAAAPAISSPVLGRRPLHAADRPEGESDDPELAAYNDYLAQVAAQGPKTWWKR